MQRTAWAVCLVFWTSVCVGQESTQRVRLATGETLTVNGLIHEGETVSFSHPLLGRLRVNRASVEMLGEGGNAGVVETALGTDGEGGVIEPARAKARAEAVAASDRAFDKARDAEINRKRLNQASWLDGWKGSLTLGVNGASGNTEGNSIRAGVGVRRESERTDTRLDLSYASARNGDEQTSSRGELNALNDWLNPGSPWGTFAQGRVEYDEFQDWRWRISGFGGVRYTVFDEPDGGLWLRAGLGVKGESGGDRNELVPEALLGAEWRRKIAERQNLFVMGEYVPSLDALSDFRVNLKAGYEIGLDQQRRISLKLGAEDRYSSTPGAGFRKNDVEYFVLLGIGF